MSKRFSLPALSNPFSSRDPQALVRAILGILLLANIAAALFLFKPWGGSPEDLARQASDLNRQIQQRKVSLARTQALVAKVQMARDQGDAFLGSYFAERRGAYLSLVAELSRAAQGAGVRPKEHSFAEEVVEGSDDMQMVTIVGNYEGNYGDLVRFINSLDRSPRFIVLEQLNASPQQATGLLTVNIKMHAFVRDTGAPIPTGEIEETPEDENAVQPEQAPPPVAAPAPAPSSPRQMPAPNITRSAPMKRVAQ